MENNIRLIQHWWRKLKASSVKKEKECCVVCGDDFFVHAGHCDECYYYKFITRKRKRFINDSYESE